MHSLSERVRALFRSQPALSVSAMLVLTLVLVVVVAGFVPLSMPALKNTVEKRASRVTAIDTVAIDGLAFTLWRGLLLRDVHCTMRPEGGPATQMDVSRAQVWYRILPLLRRKLAIRGIELHGLSIHADLPPAGKAGTDVTDTAVQPAWLTLGALSLGLPVALEVNDFRIKQGRFTIDQAGRNLLHGAGLTVALDASVADTLGAQGTVRLDSLWAPRPYLLTGIQAGLQLDRTHAAVRNASFSFCGGTGRMEFSLNNAGDTTVAGDISVTDVDLGRLMKLVRFKRGTLGGKGSLEMQVASPDFRLENVNGHGRLSAKNLTVSGLPFQRTLAAVLLLPKVEQLAFSSIGSSLRLSQECLYMPDLRGTGNVFNVTGSGSVTLDTYVNQHVDMAFSREFCTRLPPVVSQGMLLPGKGGRCRLKGRLHGKLSKMKITIDRRIKERAVIQGVGKALELLFKRR
ncbi:MAG: hypothetical protein GF418_10770 [Chitinivibrionales bacterium]|nr:hypothetical protein [Chitinivibrionales bacterium]MBD3396097.1 hypothetical protein [Chitinivibrionales bacterium]